MGAAVSSDGRVLWVSTGRGKSVVAIDTASRAVTRVVADVGERPWGLALSADGKVLFVANGPSNDVAAIDTASGAILRRIAAGRSPWGVAVGP